MATLEKHLSEKAWREYLETEHGKRLDRTRLSDFQRMFQIGYDLCRAERAEKDVRDNRSHNWLTSWKRGRHDR